MWGCPIGDTPKRCKHYNFKRAHEFFFLNRQVCLQNCEVPNPDTDCVGLVLEHCCLMGPMLGPCCAGFAGTVAHGPKDAHV